MEDEFDILAARILADEASEEERARFHRLKQEDPERYRQFLEFERTWKLLEAAGPVVHAMEAPAEPIPEQRLRQLLAEVSAGRKPQIPHQSAASDQSQYKSMPYWPARLWRLAAALVIAALVASVVSIVIRPGSNRVSVASETPAPAYLVTTHGQPEVRRVGRTLRSQPVTSLRVQDEIRLPAGSSAMLITSNGTTALLGPRQLTLNVGDLTANSILPGSNVASAALRVALFTPATQLLGAGLLAPATRSGDSIPLYSPVGATASLTPTLLWKPETGKTYDLVLTDEFNGNTPPWRLSGAVPPVLFGQVAAWQGRSLAPDGLYRLRLMEAGKPLTASEYTFRTLSGLSPAAPAERGDSLANAFAILTSDPSRVGDALAELLSLPGETADSELALRLKSFIFGQLGYTADFEATLARLAPPTP